MDAANDLSSYTPIKLGLLSPAIDLKTFGLSLILPVELVTQAIVSRQGQSINYEDQLRLLNDAIQENPNRAGESNEPQCLVFEQFNLGSTCTFCSKITN